MYIIDHFLTLCSKAAITPLKFKAIIGKVISICLSKQSDSGRHIYKHIAMPPLSLCIKVDRYTI